MSAERDHRLPHLDAGNHRGFAGHTDKLDEPEVYSRRGAVEDPNASLPSIIEHGSERYLDFPLTRLICKSNGHCRPKRCRYDLTVEDITGLIGARLGIGGVR